MQGEAWKEKLTVMMIGAHEGEETSCWRWKEVFCVLIIKISVIVFLFLLSFFKFFG